MEKGVFVTTDNEVTVKDFSRPLHLSLGESVGGYIEIVHPVGLKGDYIMIVNEEGLLEELDQNIVGSALYGTQFHGQPIVGNIVLMKQGWYEGEPDVVGLTDAEAEELRAMCEMLLSPLKEKEDG